MSKVVVITSQCALDKGEASIVNSTVQRLRERFPYVKIYLTSTHPEIDGVRYDEKVLPGVFVREPNYKMRVLLWYMRIFLYWVPFSLHRFLGVWVYGLFPRSQRATFYLYSRADVVLINSGDILSSLYGHGDIFYFYLIFLLKISKRKVVVFGHTIGPFHRSLDIFLAKIFLNMVDLITLRDKHSKYYLDRINVTRPPIFITADPAFLLRPAPPEQVLKTLKEEGLETSPRGPLFGIAVSSIAEGYGLSYQPGYIELLENLCTSISEKYPSAIVILLPHHFGPGSDNDIILCQKVMKNIDKKYKDRVKTIRHELRPEILKGIIGELELLIAFRLHPLIHAISMGIPSIAVEYDHKVTAIMNELGMSYYCQHIKNLSLEEILQKVDSAYSNITRIRSELRSAREKLTQRAFYNIRLLEQFLQS